MNITPRRIIDPLWHNRTVGTNGANSSYGLTNIASTVALTLLGAAAVLGFGIAMSKIGTSDPKVVYVDASTSIDNRTIDRSVNNYNTSSTTLEQVVEDKRQLHITPPAVPQKKVVPPVKKSEPLAGALVVQATYTQPVQPQHESVGRQSSLDLYVQSDDFYAFATDVALEFAEGFYGMDSKKISGIRLSPVSDEVIKQYPGIIFDTLDRLMEDTNSIKIEGTDGSQRLKGKIASYLQNQGFDGNAENIEIALKGLNYVFRSDNNKEREYNPSELLQMADMVYEGNERFLL